MQNSRELKSPLKPHRIPLLQTRSSPEGIQTNLPGFVETMNCKHQLLRLVGGKSTTIKFIAGKISTGLQTHFKNKKVLLRERKRHTDRGVSSTQSVTRGGVPPIRVPPSQVWQRGVPEVGYPSVGVPHQGTPSHQGTPQLDLAGVPPPGVDRQTDGWMDRHVSKHDLPSYYVCGR